MNDIISKYSKGKEVIIGENRAIITSDVMKFKSYYAIYADIIENVGNSSCFTCKIDDNLALIVRDKNRLLKMRFKC